MAYDLVARLVMRDEMSGPLRTIMNQMSMMDKVIGTTDGAITSYTDATSRATRSDEKLAAATKMVASETDKLGDTADVTKKSVDRMSDALDEAVAKSDRSSRSLRAMQRGARQAAQGFEWLGKKVNSALLGIGKATLRAPFTLPGAIIGGMGAYGATRYGFLEPLKLSSEFEQAEIAFTTMLGSAEKAQQFIEEMNKFAVETPFDVQGVQEASKRMLAFGFELEDVLPTLTAVGNASAGLGLGTDGIDRITLALGQMRAKSKVSAEEMLQLTEAGIPAWEILAKKLNVTTAEVMKFSEKGLIPAEKAIDLLVDGMNEKFPDMMAKQAESLAGLKNQIQETFNIKILKSWGDGLAKALKPRFQAVNDWIDKNQETLIRWGKTLEQVASQGLEWVLNKVEGSFKYISDKYINNPAFMELDFSGKLSFIIEDLKGIFNKWYSSGGQEQIRKIAEDTSNFLATALTDNVGTIVSAALTIGKEIGLGIINGLQDVIKDHPIISGLGFAALAPGGAAVKFGGGAAIALEGLTRKATEVISDSGILDPGKRFIEESAKYLPSTDDLKRWATFGMWKPDGSHSGGLSNVPYNGYRAVLHQGERVLTAEQNREYSQGGGGVNITFGNININGASRTSEEMAEEIMVHIAREIRTGISLGV